VWSRRLQSGKIFGLCRKFVFLSYMRLLDKQVFDNSYQGQRAQTEDGYLAKD
jgi:hypothetical protein